MSKDIEFLQPKSKNVIIKRDVKFDENISSCESTLTGVSPLACDPDLTYVPPLSISSTSNKIPSTSNDESEDVNPPPPPQDLPSTSQLPKWVRFTWDAIGSLERDPADQRRTSYQL